MASLVEEYVLLALRLGRHVSGLFDFYYGPRELSAEVEAEQLAEPALLVETGVALCDRISCSTPVPGSGVSPFRASPLSRAADDHPAVVNFVTRA